MHSQKDAAAFTRYYSASTFMSEIDRIRGFLRGVRRRAYWEASLRLGGITLTTMLLTLLLMALCASHIGPAGFWPRVTFTVLTILTLLGVGAGAFGPIRRLRSELGVARFVGRRHPPLASDLVSAVQLSHAEQPRGTSAGILRAFFASVAESVTPMDVRRLVPLRPAAFAGGAVGAAGLLVLLAALLLPGTIARGLGLLVRVPTRFEGAVVSSDPLIGDVRISYTYPRYTGLPGRVVEGSTGDIVAVKGTEVVLETKLLRRAREALLLLGDAGEAGERPVELGEGRLRAAFKVEESGSYRVWLAPLFGRPVRESRAHRIVAEADEAPRVEIFGPADRLELATPRPIEVGFSATDDFGLGPVELVYRVEDGPEQRIRLKEPTSGMRATQGRTVFEPNLDRAAPGSRVAYRVEAKDNDGVSGSKTGSSRTLYVVIADPRESLDEQLLREREILDRLIVNLANRLEALDPEPEPAKPAAGGSSARPGSIPWDNSSKLVLWLSVHEELESHVAALGRIIDDERRSGSGSKAVLGALSSIADRLARKLREEAALLGSLRGRVSQGVMTTTVGGAAFDRLLKHEAKHVEELETAVLMLDDLIGRQRLEDLSDMAKTLSDTYKRLQDLLARYQATKDEALRRQIEREIRDLRARIEQLGTKIAALKARNEVPTEWQNMPNLDKAMDRASEFSNLLEKGDMKSLSKALAELGGALSDVRKMLEGNSEAFGENRFAQENKAMSEALRQIGDLESDERMLAGDSSSLAEETEQAAAKARAAELDKFLAEARDKAERLRRRLGKNPPEELSDDGQDELKRAQESAKQLRRLLGEHEWGEGKKEAERAVSSLRRLRRELDQRQQKNQQRPSAAQEEFSESMNDARSIAQEIASDLDKLTPKPGEGMSQEQRGRSQGMAQRQRSLGERAEELAKEAARNAGKAGGLDQASNELRQIAEQMGQAQQDLQRGDPREGSGKAREAADRLAKLRDEMRDGRKEANGRNRREPVRIPGADESKAPREWRHELLEAMRERAPERYGEEVRKYYEEIAK
jgi:hypothetical protein